ncbi:rRNA-processing protein FCF2 [Aureobasidium subglaciale]|nr:rRNA-processing protein FCF2 [Aureobasidium subglaciale]KAI5216660.1 rRNA-processing protein FCF2 [Aureobasidium subglaciale]KAI5219938.1 rRNA-processing protein FCF2 [Aureobasidium subglaciale]KAI5257799.1 rRNA-processing protein FCF2 [Aureobasidium subglaciale]
MESLAEAGIIEAHRPSAKRKFKKVLADGASSTSLFLSLTPRKMADVISFAPQHEEELSDEQMQEMLAQAAQRRKQNASVALFDKGDDKANQFNLPKLNTGEMVQPYVSNAGDIATVDRSRLLAEQDRKLSNQIRKVEDPVAIKKKTLESKKATAGEQWYNMPRTDLTPELKRDLQLLKMRNVLDPHRHYKKDGGKMRAPDYSQVGTIVEGPTEYFSGRLNNKERKKTFVDEVLSREKDTGRFKKKYSDIQTSKTSGKKSYYKELQSKRSFDPKKR